MTGPAGRTAVVVPVPGAEPLVGRWRDRFDPSAAHGMPAHMTLLYPWRPADLITGNDLEDLAALCAAVPEVAVTFARCGRFDDALWLAPYPSAPFAALTRAVAARWPEHPPYGATDPDPGAAVSHLTVVPHLTVAQGHRDHWDEIEAALTPVLPLRVTVTGAALFGWEGGRWVLHRSLAFGVP